MKILFILGPYRPGRCGISDYVRLLSERLENLGHECMRMSVDPGVGATLETTADSLPPCDAVSLQFAPYAFHPKGLPGQCLQSLAKALAGRHLQVMFHEIWIGAYPQATLRERWNGGRQRRQVLRFLETAQPFAVHATNAAALNRLELTGIEAEYLYLFGNVPWAESPSAAMNPDPAAHVAFFGTPYDAFPYDLLFERLVETFTAMKRPWNIQMLGHVREKTGLKKLRREADRHEITVKETSTLTSEELSHGLQVADCGVATTPYDVLGKSGAAAAMLEHGLPLVAFDDGDTPEEALFPPEPFEDRIVLLGDKNFARSMGDGIQAPKPTFFDGVSHTTKGFVRAIGPSA